MLVLSRKKRQALIIEGPCVIEIREIRRSHVRLGILADRSVNIRRAEVPDDRKTAAAVQNPSN